jgi:hypothetical protein
MYRIAVLLSSAGIAAALAQQAHCATKPIMPDRIVITRAATLVPSTPTKPVTLALKRGKSSSEGNGSVTWTAIALAESGGRTD